MFMFMSDKVEKKFENKPLMVEVLLALVVMLLVVAELLISDFQMETGKILVLLNRELS